MSMSEKDKNTIQNRVILSLINSLTSYNPKLISQVKVYFGDASRAHIAQYKKIKIAKAAYNLFSKYGADGVEVAKDNGTLSLLNSLLNGKAKGSFVGKHGNGYFTFNNKIYFFNSTQANALRRMVAEYQKDATYFYNNKYTFQYENGQLYTDAQITITIGGFATAMAGINAPQANDNVDMYVYSALSKASNVFKTVGKFQQSLARYIGDVQSLMSKGETKGLASLFSGGTLGFGQNPGYASQLKQSEDELGDSLSTLGYNLVSNLNTSIQLHQQKQQEILLAEIGTALLVAGTAVYTVNDLWVLADNKLPSFTTLTGRAISELGLSTLIADAKVAATDIDIGAKICSSGSIFTFLSGWADYFRRDRSVVAGSQKLANGINNLAWAMKRLFFQSSGKSLANWTAGAGTSETIPQNLGYLKADDQGSSWRNPWNQLVGQGIIDGAGKLNYGKIASLCQAEGQSNLFNGGHLYINANNEKGYAYTYWDITYQPGTIDHRNGVFGNSYLHFHEVGIKA